MKKFYLLIVLFSCCLFSAQQVSTMLEKNTIELGEVTTLTIKATELKGGDISAKPKDKLLPFHFEIVKDSIAISEDEYYRVVDFTIYEEGIFTIPELDFIINDNLYQTVPYQVTVVNPVSEGDKMYDIMNNKELSLSLADYWGLYKFYILVALLIIAIILMLIAIIKYFRREKNTPKEKSHQALKMLSLLEKKRYIEQLNYRMFYVELIDIIRRFITEQYHIPADILLTDDLVHLMKETEIISTENENLLEQVFTRGDQVKFAKMIPDKDTMIKDLKNIKKFVKQSVKDIELENLRKGV